ncbi:MAG: NAD(P)/FAD-dependent oxidoreductase [Sphingomonadaceae bacterium]|nr:NAD(P)/FAD-dependent oxidoreductase [Sphingomonadaceae bacterium]
MAASKSNGSASGRDLDVVVIGAGFAGLAALHQLRDRMNYSVRAIEAGSAAGGTWYWNRYPGARCDVESMQYSLSISPEVEQEWSWTERFATQGEILDYTQFLVDRLDLAKDIDFNTRVASAVYDESDDSWTVTTEGGDSYRCRWLIMAAGPLSTPNVPDFPGLDSFQGEFYHTGAWPKDQISFAGKRVAQIGTGSSGVQIAQEISKDAAKHFVLQRTAHHIIPAGNRPLHPGEQEEVKARYPELRKFWQTLLGATFYQSLPTDPPLVPGDKSIFDVAPAERQKIFDAAWNYGGYGFQRAFTDVLKTIDASVLAGDYIASKIREKVKDPQTAEKLISSQYFGTKRVIIDKNYYDIFNQDNVELVDVKGDPIDKITPTGIQLQSGRQIDVDTIVCATGFDALTGALTRMDIRGRGGSLLRDVWKEGPESHLGLMVSGFPGMFIIGGPQSCSALANVITANEQQVDWICECITYLDEKGFTSIEPDSQAQADWVEHVNELADATIYTKGDSWYTGANIDGKPRGFLLYVGGYPNYKAACDEIASKGYDGFRLEKAKELT